MGSHVTVHVGFYLQVKPQNVNRVTSVFVCTGNPEEHSGALSRTPGPFCQQCGSPIEKREMPYVEHESHPVELLSDDFGDMFMTSGDNHSAWIPNFEIKTSSGVRINNSYSTSSDSCANPIDTQLIEKYRGLILRDGNFSSVMTYLKDTYGPDCVELMYGVVVEWN